MVSSLLICLSCKINKDVGIFSTFADLRIFPQRSCKPLLRLAPPASIQPANLISPELSVIPFEVDENASFPIIRAKKDRAADLSYYQACMKHDIRCKTGFLINAPHIVPIEYPGTYYFRAYSCIWRDRAHQKTGSLNLVLENLSKQKLYCSKPSEPIAYTFKKKPANTQILKMVQEYELARNKFHKALIDFRHILKAYQDHAKSPPISLLSQIMSVLYLRDNLHSIVGNEYFNHSIYFTYRLTHRYNHLASSLPISANMIRNCASNNILNHMQEKEIPKDPYSYQGYDADELDNLSSISALTSEKLSLMSEATALAILASGGAAATTKESLRTIQYQVLNNHFTNYSQTPEQSPILFGVGVAFTTTTAMEIQRLKKNTISLSDNQEEIEFYQKLNKWAEEFISVRHDYLKLKKDLHIQRLTINE